MCKLSAMSSFIWRKLPKSKNPKSPKEVYLKDHVFQKMGNTVCFVCFIPASSIDEQSNLNINKQQNM